MRPNITVEEFENAEREVLTRDARRVWRRQALLYAVAFGVIVLLSVYGSVHWLVYLAVVAWGIWVGARFVTYVRNGDAHYREQQIRAEWRAQQTKEQAVTKL